MRIAVLLVFVAAFGPLASAQPAAPGGVGRDRAAGTARRSAPAPRMNPAAMLQARFADVNLQDSTLREALEWIAAATGANVVIRWDQLEIAGVSDDAEVSIRARNLRLRQVLWMILNQVSPPDTRLAYRISRDMILISTEQDLSQEMIVRVYNVTDIVATEIATPEIGIGRTHQIPTITGFGVAPGAAAANLRPQEVNSGVRIRADNPRGVDEDSEDAGRNSFDERMQELADVITATVEPESWDVNGGNGTIRIYRGMLIVRNSPFVHQKLGGPIDE